MAGRPTRSAVVAPPAPQPPWGDVLASIQDAVFVLDRKGCIEDINPAAEQLTGISAAHASGVEIDALLHVASSWIGEMARGTLQEGAARRRSEGTLVRGRTEVPVAAACAPWFDASGGLRGAVLVLHDLSLQQSLDATTRRADRLAALGTVALGLAHEIRNPLGGIKGAAQLIRGAATDPETIHCTDVIIREVDRLDGLIEQLREVSTPPRLRLEAVNIHRVLNDVLALQRQAPSWGAVSLRAIFDPSLPAVHGDRAQLTQVFLNLVKNALEALGGKGELCVSTVFDTRFHIRRGSGRGRFISVLVEDSGPGIAEDHQAQLFSPFFSTKARGTGLGLALCHRIVTEHGGAIGYETRPTGGACFRVTLRVSEDEHQ